MSKTFQDMVRQSLLQYPTLFRDPLDVACHMFTTIGGGYEWNADGELVYFYNDPWDGKPREDCFKTKLPRPMRRFVMRDQSLLRHYQFVQDNLEKILACESLSTLALGASELRHCHYVVKPCLEYAAGLNPPVNITKPWAEVLHDFLRWWTYNLNCVYQPMDAEKRRKHWPEAAAAGYDRIQAVDQALYPVLYGKTYEVFERDHAVIMDEIFGSLKAEEEEAKRQAP